MVKKIYHIFGNNWDEYTTTKSLAYAIYKDAIKEGQTMVRLYSELYDDESGDSWGEDFMEGIGDFPY